VEQAVVAFVSLNGSLVQQFVFDKFLSKEMFKNGIISFVYIVVGCFRIMVGI